LNLIIHAEPHACLLHFFSSALTEVWHSLCGDWVTVIFLSVCLSVCLSVTRQLLKLFLLCQLKSASNETWCE